MPSCEPNAVLVAAIRAGVAKWAPRLRLQDWDWSVVADHDEEDSGGCVTAHAWKTLVTIHARPDVVAYYRESYPEWAGETDEQLTERFTVHEMVHVLNGNERLEFMRLFESWFGEAGQAAACADLHRRFIEMEEAIVCRVTRALIDGDRAGGWSTAATPEPPVWRADHWDPKGVVDEVLD